MDAKRRQEKVAQSRETKVQQGGTWLEELESIAREGSSRKEVRRTFKILREVWLNIRMEKIDTHKGVMVKALFVIFWKYDNYIIYFS